MTKANEAGKKSHTKYNHFGTIQQMNTESTANSRLRSLLTPSTAVLIVGLIVRLAVFAILISAPQRAFNGGDSNQYTLLAQNLIDHGAFSLRDAAPFTPNLFRTPGYPLLLAILYVIAGHQHSAILIVIVQILLSLLNIYLMMEIGKHLFSPPIVILGGLLYALAPAAAIYISLIMTETFFATVLLFGVLTFLKIMDSNRGWIYAAISGLILGIAVYVRPIGLYFIPIPMLVLIVKLGWNRRSVRLALIMGIVFASSLIPWFYRNWAEFHVLTFTSLANGNLLTYNVGSIEAQRQKISWREAKDQLWAEVGEQAQAQGIDISNDAQASQLMGSIAMKHILAHPFDAALYQSLDMINSLRPGYSMATLLLHDNGQEFGLEIQAGILSVIWKAPMPDALIYMLITVYYVVLYGLILIGGIVLVWRRSWLALVVLGLIPFWFIYSPGAAGNARFRAPVEGFLTLIAGVGISWIWNLTLQRHFSALKSRFCPQRFWQATGGKGYSQRAIRKA